MTSPFQTIITALKRVSKPRTSKAGTTVRACCPSCGGGNRSKLVVTETPGGSVLIHCFAGCGAIDVLGSIGLDLADLFPSDQKRSRATPTRHDSHTLTGMAIEIINEVEFLLLRHAVAPVTGIAGVLVERAGELAHIRELLKEGCK